MFSILQQAHILRPGVWIYRTDQCVHAASDFNPSGECRLLGVRLLLAIPKHHLAAIWCPLIALLLTPFASQVKDPSVSLMGSKSVEV